MDELVWVRVRVKEVFVELLEVRENKEGLLLVLELVGISVACVAHLSVRYV